MVEYAPWPRRILSAVVDLIVLTALTLPFIAPMVSPDQTEAPALSGSEVRVATVISIVAQVAYFTAMHAWRGSTIGKMAARTVLLREDGTPVAPGVAFVRAVTLVGINFVSGLLLFAPAVVNGLRPLWHPRRQTWHDQVAKTVVVIRPRAVV